MYYCQEIKDKQVWDSFVTSQPNHTFLHSFAWGDFNAQTGDKVWRFGIFKSGHQNNDPIQIGSQSGHNRVTIGSHANFAQIFDLEAKSSVLRSKATKGHPFYVENNPILIGLFLVIKVHARRGNFLFVPHGPVLAEGEENHKSQITNSKQITNHKLQIFKTLNEKLKEIAKQEKVSFIRISPLLEDTAENRRLFSELGFMPAPTHMHAETTWTLDVSPSQDELLMAMRKTTRNLIRRAEKEGVEIRTGTSESDVEGFYKLYGETVKKHHFTPFSLAYLKKQTNIFKEADCVKVFTAWHKNEALASAIVIFYGNSAFYHHGASRQSKIPAAYLLQWEAIKEAKRRGHKYYNFWGIIKEDVPASHPWAGITLFKKGFGGFQSDYLHAQDLPVSWKYWPSYIFETLRRRRRGL